MLTLQSSTYTPSHIFVRFIIILPVPQAYTVELEAELNQLKEENKQLKHDLVYISVLLLLVLICMIISQ
jgi:hypothetical protein